MTLKPKLFKNYIELNKSFFRIINIKRYKFKGKIIHKNSIEFGSNKEFQVTKKELEIFFKHNRNLYIKSAAKFSGKKFNYIFKGLEFHNDPLLNNDMLKKKINSFLNKFAVVKALRMALHRRKVILGRFLTYKRGGATICFAGFFTFVPQSHFVRYRKNTRFLRNHLFSNCKNKKIRKKFAIRHRTLFFTIISVKYFKNKRISAGNLSIVLSRKFAIKELISFNKKSNSKRIHSLKKLSAICF